MAADKKEKRVANSKASRRIKRNKRFLKAWQKLPSYPLWDQVEIRLKAGEAGFSLAKWWKSQGQMKHLAIKTLAKYLTRYQNEGIPEDERIKDGPVSTYYINKLVQKYAGQINIFEDMAILINVQWERLNTVLEEENKFPLEMTNRVVTILQGLYRDLFEFEVKTGRLVQAPQKFEHSFSTKINRDSEEEDEREAMQRKRQVAETALAIMKLVSRAGIEKAKEIEASVDIKNVTKVNNE